MQVIKQTNPTVKNETPLNLRESCLACRTLNMASFPVHLTEIDGKVTLVCYVARCLNCGYIKNYGMYNGIFKLTGNRPDFGMRYWPELQRNGITPDEFVEAVLEASRDKGRTIWLDARTGLKQAEPSESYKQIIRKWEGLLNGRRAF